jgi:site-specific recombinase XerD
MLEKFLHASKRIQGPLLFHIRTFATSLAEDGYLEAAAKSKLWCLADLGRWMERKGLTVANLNEPRVEAFVRRYQQVGRGDPKTLEQFRDHLRKRGVIPDRKPACDRSPLAEILGRYEKHLRSERGLVVTTILNYQSFVRKFLVERFREGPFHFAEVKPSDISSFVLRHGPSMSPRGAQLMTTAFRSFFRFLFQHGELKADLAASVPTVADWRLSTVPKYMTPEEVGRMLQACNRHTATGRRDYAILLLLARLGLRAGEVVALELDDVDWRAGEILVRGKGLCHERMPLPVEVGEAVTSYLLRDRPACQTRRVFVRMRAPRGGFNGHSGVTSIVGRALHRAQLHPAVKGAHLLRHSLATSLLRSGATMGEIGEVLRHRRPATTEIYAKVDFEGLRSVALPWPMGGGR